MLQHIICNTLRVYNDHGVLQIAHWRLLLYSLTPHSGAGKQDIESAGKRQVPGVCRRAGKLGCQGVAGRWLVCAVEQAS